MLNDKDIVATIAVKDTAAAKQFYEGVLGLEPASNDMGGTSYKCGSGSLFVYQSQYAGTNQATAASWAVGDDLEKIAGQLKAGGIKFEHYDDIPGTIREGDIHIMGNLKSVWFKDPDGNILNLVNG
jgi:catechol 2,3-dioxygenase-like lactoylglutathione lyase family enzyme